MAETVSCACGWDPFVKRPAIRAAVEWIDQGEWARKAVRAHIAVNATSDRYHAMVEPGGSAPIGERGPERVTLHAGERVFSNDQIRRGEYPNAAE